MQIKMHCIAFMANRCGGSPGVPARRSPCTDCWDIFAIRTGYIFQAFSTAIAVVAAVAVALSAFHTLGHPLRFT